MEIYNPTSTEMEDKFFLTHPETWSMETWVSYRSTNFDSDFNKPSEGTRMYTRVREHYKDSLLRNPKQLTFSRRDDIATDLKDSFVRKYDRGNLTTPSKKQSTITQLFTPKTKSNANKSSIASLTRQYLTGSYLQSK